MLIYYDTDNMMHIFREIPFFRPQNDTNNSEMVNENDMRSEVTYLFLLLCSVLARKIIINLRAFDYFMCFDLCKITWH